MLVLFFLKNYLNYFDFNLFNSGWNDTHELVSADKFDVGKGELTVFSFFFFSKITNFYKKTISFRNG